MPAVHGAGTREELAGAALAAFGDLRRSSAVGRVDLDGGVMLAHLELDGVEHRRRRETAAGAVTSGALLHDLWDLPAGVEVPSPGLSDPARLEELTRLRLVEHRDGTVVRRYTAAGTVDAVAFVGRRPDGVITRAVRFTPIVERYALIPDDVVVSASHRAMATEWGIGLAVILRNGAVRTLTAPMEAVVGVPSVYRWWLAERVYAGLGYDSVQPVSCGLGATGPWMPARP